MNSKMTTNNNNQQLNIKKQTKQTGRTGRESQKWRSHEGLSPEREREENGGKGTENKQHNCQVQNKQGEVKNGIGNREAKEHICLTHQHELRWVMLVGGGCRVEKDKGEKKMAQL